MDLGLGNKVAWVLGGSSGLGKASASALAAEGASVALSARGEPELRTAADEIRRQGRGACISVPADVTDPADIESAAQHIVEELGGIDILVSNAGGPPPGSFENFDDKALYDAFTLTTASAWRLTKAVLPSMRERGGGALVYITSITTKEIIGDLLFSNMMRAAVVGMMKTISRELASDGIRAVCVAPGLHDTPRVQALDQARAEREGRPLDDVRAESAAGVPRGRLGDPAEFGAAVAFLASDAASFINGITLTVDGGGLRTLTA